MHSFFDLTYFREVGQKYRNIFVRFLVQMKTSKSHSEINWPLLMPIDTGKNFSWHWWAMKIQKVIQIIVHISFDPIVIHSASRLKVYLWVLQCLNGKKRRRRLYTRYHSKNFVRVGHETMYADIGNHHFFTIPCHRQTHQSY